MAYNNRGGNDGGGRRRRRFTPKRVKACYFCAEKINFIDYKDADMLRRYVTERGKIRPQRQTGLCAKCQRRMAVAIKRARHMALLPFVAESEA
ncbi:MAG: 30S ribosomal protein S18 [Anaerolineae bacterium]|nr:30S ribosomal protein S18 [Anaerolineae bacterium]